MDYSSQIEDVVGLRFRVCHSPSQEVRSDDDVRGGGFCEMVLGERICECGCLGVRLNGKGDLDSFL